MLDKVESAIKRYSLIKEGDTVVAGVSGGADSVALLIALLKLSERMGFSVCAAHLNHGIRGEAAAHDQGFVKDLCEFHGVPLYVEELDVPLAAKAAGQTLEQAGRILRYDFLERAKRHFEAQSIAVAHHMDDQAESILLHLTRGSGLLGLVGMQPRRGDIIRPLLGVRRSEIEGYLFELETVYCTDDTNFERDGTRNRLRLDVIPYIEKNINPGFVGTLCSMGELLFDDERYLSQQAREALDSARSQGGYDRKTLAALPRPILSRAIRLALSDAGAVTDIERVHVDNVIGLLSARTGARLHLPHVEAWVTYERICFGVAEDMAAFSMPLVIGGETGTPLGTFTAEYVQGNRYERRADIAYMDRAKLPAGGLTVRTRQNGDRFYPLGAPGRRKLKDYFIDKKVPREQRVLPLVCCGDEALFVPNFGVSETVKVTGDTVEMLKIAYCDIKFYKR